MSLPKPKTVPVTNSYTAETKDSVAVVWSTTYTATAMYEQFGVSTKILESMNLLNSNFTKLLMMLTQKQQVDDNKNEEDNLEKKPRVSNPVKSDTNMSDLYDTAKTLLLGSVALLGTTIITLLDETKKKFTKDLLVTTLAITAFSRDLAEDTVKFVKGVLNIVPNIFKGTINLIKNLSTDIAPIKKAIDAIRIAFWDARLAFGDIEFIKKIGPMVEKFMKPVKAILGFIYDFSVALTKGVASIAESGALKVLKAFAPMITTVLEKILWPIQLLFTISDFINGFMEGYAKEGVVEGIKEGLQKAFDGFFGSLKDVVKTLTVGALKWLGAEKTAEGVAKDMDKIWGDIENVIGGLLYIFKGIAQLDGKAIWKGMTKTAGGIQDFFVDQVKGAFNVIVNLLSDLTGVDIQKKIDDIMIWFEDSVVKEIKGLFEMVYSKLLDAIRWIVENSLPYGEELANKIFGAKKITPEQIDTEAKKLAEQKAYDRLNGVVAKMSSTLAAWGISPSGDKNKLKYEVTEDDRNEARQNFVDKGSVVPGYTPISKPKEMSMTDRFLSSIGAFAADATKDKPSINIQNNNTTGKQNNSSTVVTIPRAEKAGHATPIGRYSYPFK